MQSAGVATRFEEGASVHWFKPERFLEPDFDAEQYVADARRYVSDMYERGKALLHILIQVIAVLNGGRCPAGPA